MKASADLAEYEVTLRHDSMAPRYRLWFWFTVNNATPGQRAIISVVCPPCHSQAQGSGSLSTALHQYPRGCRRQSGTTAGPTPLFSRHDDYPGNAIK